MSFYFRKSVSFGPIRMNFSKSGIGVSAGVKGARISTGPRGTYIHLGSNGIYYRQKIGDSAFNTQPAPYMQPNGNSSSPVGTIPTANVNDLIESSNEELVAQINSRIHQPIYAPMISIISTVTALGVAFLAYATQRDANGVLDDVHFIRFALILTLTICLWIAGLSIAWLINRKEKVERTTVLEYELDNEAKAKYLAVQNALLRLAESKSLWRVISQTPNWDWKRQAGATSIITRTRLTIGHMLPPFIQTRTKVYSILLDSMRLFFLPDQVLVFQNGNYGAVSYKALQVQSWPTRFIEDQGVPNDSIVVGQTWQYVRKDGGPDMRFRNNRQIPIAQYGHLQLASHTGMNLQFHVSNLPYCELFAQVISNYAHFYHQTHQSSSSKTSTSDAQKGQSRGESPYTVLHLQPNASRDEITTAYRKMAQIYHPDKVAGLAPEFRELAEKHMKAINAAYEQLKYGT